MGAYSRWGAQNISWVVGHIPVEIFLLVDYFFNATHSSNAMFFKGLANFH